MSDSLLRLQYSVPLAAGLFALAAGGCAEPAKDAPPAAEPAGVVSDQALANCLYANTPPETRAEYRRYVEESQSGGVDVERSAGFFRLGKTLGEQLCGVQPGATDARLVQRAIDKWQTRMIRDG